MKRVLREAFSDADGNIDWKKAGYQARSIFAVTLSLAVLLGGGWFVYAKVNDAYVAWRTTEDYIGTGTEDTEVVIPRGATITQMGDILTEASVVKSTKAFRKAAQESGRSSKLTAGRFKLRKHVPAKLALESLLDPGKLLKTWVLFPEGTTQAEQRTIMFKATKLPQKSILEASAQAKNYPLPQYANGKLEGFLFPAKYQVAEPPSAAAVLTTQIKQFNTVAEKLKLTEEAKKIGRSPHDVVVAASIIAAEVNKPEYQPKVAAVIYNRLKQKAKLEMDSTVHYAVGKSGKVTTTDQDRKSDSPYNTYVHKGLPPGPISNPGESALAAALTPEPNSKDLYFVTVNLDTGETKFAEKLEDHNKHKAEFQAWCQANKGRC